MEPYDVFLRKRVRIGEGMMSRVFSWNGFAYKCFGEGYPAEMISREYEVQSEIARSGLLHIGIPEQHQDGSAPRRFHV